MSNEHNLTPFDSERARIAGKKGAIAKAEKAKQRKKLQEVLEVLLALPADDKNIKAMEKLGINVKDKNNVTNNMLLAIALFQKAVHGDTRAIQLIAQLTNAIPATKIDEEKLKLEKKRVRLEEQRFKAKLEELNNSDDDGVVIVNDI